MESILVTVSTLRAEVLWTLKLASSHFCLRLYLGLSEFFWTMLKDSKIAFSLRSCLGLKMLFWSMFTDSEIVKTFQLSKTKCGSIINFGLAPYFKDLLLKEIKSKQSIERGANGCAD